MSSPGAGGRPPGNQTSAELGHADRTRHGGREQAGARHGWQAQLVPVARDGGPGRGHTLSTPDRRGPVGGSAEDCRHLTARTVQVRLHHVQGEPGGRGGVERGAAGLQHGHPGRAGQPVGATRFARVPGGKGANQALAARRLGSGVRLVAAVGDDPVADEALALLRAGGVDLSRVRRVAGQPSGLALITVDAAGENTIVVVGGANAVLEVEPADLAAADAVLCQLEVPMSAVAAAAQCSPAGALFCLNAAPAGAVRVLDEVLDRADLVVANRAERAALPELAGARLLAVTAGEDGAVLVEQHREADRAAAPRVSVVDGTAAGDAFVAALALGLRGGLGRTAALRRACAAGAVAATRAGAQPSLPSAADVDALLDEQPPAERPQ